MKWLGRWTKWVRDNPVEVDVSESAGVRYLHLGSPTVQSAMSLSNPDKLVLTYTRSAMGFLLFKPDPEQIVSIGLGGGSMQKWLLNQLPSAMIHTVELHEEVVRAAHQYFGVPLQDERLRIIVGDGADWVRERQDLADALLVDGYDGKAQSASVCSEAFYRDAHAHLRADGVLVVNLWGSDRNYDDYVKRIEAVFGPRVLALPAAEKGNIIILAFRGMPYPTTWKELTERARALEAKHGLEFTQFVPMLRKLNLHNERRLLV